MKNKTNLLSQLCCSGTKIFMVAATLFLAQAASADICWKDSSGRGVGTIPNVCPPGTKATLVGTCLTICPDGYRDDGLFCRKAEYGRGFGYAHMPIFGVDGFAKCKRETGKDCEMCLAMVYPKCAPGFQPAGCNICAAAAPICPAGWTEFAGSCTKKSTTASCPAGKENDAGLCYNPCSGMKGIGPVCWGGCPTGMIDCGAMCGGSITECLQSVGESVVAGATAIGKIAAMVATLGASAGIGGGVTGVIEAVKQAATDKAKEIGSSVLDAGKSVKAIGQGFIETLQKKGLSPSDLADTAKASAVLGQMQYEQIKKALGGDEGIKTLTQAAQAGSNVDSWLKLAASIDPTGLAQLAMTFKKPICGK